MFKIKNYFQCGVILLSGTLVLYGCTTSQKKTQPTVMYQPQRVVQTQNTPKIQEPAPIKDTRALNVTLNYLVPEQGKFKKLIFLWRKDNVSNQARPAPVVDSNAIYLNMGGFIALDKKSGEVLWKYTGPFEGGSNIDSSPSLLKDVLIAGTNSYAVIAMDTKTGQAKWIYKTGGWVQAPVHVDTDSNQIFFGAWDKKFHAIQASDGQGIWTYPTQCYVGNEAYSHNGLVFYCESSSVVCLSVEGGIKLDEYSFGKPFFSGPIGMKQDMFGVWCCDGYWHILKINPNSKKLEEVNKLEISLSDERSPQEGFPHARYLKFGNDLIIMCDWGLTACLDMEKQKVLWKSEDRDFQERYEFMAKFNQDQVLLMQGDGTLVCKDVATGKNIWKNNLPGLSSAQIAYDNEYLYAVGTREGFVAAYRFQSE